MLIAGFFGFVMISDVLAWTPSQSGTRAAAIPLAHPELDSRYPQCMSIHTQVGLSKEQALLRCQWPDVLESSADPNFSTCLDQHTMKATKFSPMDASELCTKNDQPRASMHPGFERCINIHDHIAYSSQGSKFPIYVAMSLCGRIKTIEAVIQNLSFEGCLADGIKQATSPDRFPELLEKASLRCSDYSQTNLSCANNLVEKYCWEPKSAYLECKKIGRTSFSWALNWMKDRCSKTAEDSPVKNLDQYYGGSKAAFDRSYQNYINSFRKSGPSDPPKVKGSDVK